MIKRREEKGETKMRGSCTGKPFVKAGCFKGRTEVGHTSTEGDQMCLLEAEIRTLMVDLFTQI